jgi:hypothetical protein
MLEKQRIQQLEMDEERRIHQLEKQSVELELKEVRRYFPITGSQPSPCRAMTS